MSHEHGNDGNPEDPPLAGRWYADQFRIGHSAFEFKVDCGHESSDQDLTTVYLRLITNPSNARVLFRQLGAGLLHYADVFGPIVEDDNGKPAGSDV